MGSSASQQLDKNTQNPTLSNIVTTIIAILTTFGVPTAILTTWQTFFLQHPLWFIPLGLIFILLVILFVRLQPVLDDIFMKPLIEWIEIQLIRIFSRTWQRYSKALFSSQEAFRTTKMTRERVLSLEFLKIFVEPRIKWNDKVKGIEPSPIGEPVSLSTGNTQTIDYFLTKKEFSKYPLIIVLGSPGSGKSALLQYLTLMLTKNKFHRLFHSPHHRALLGADGQTPRYSNLLHSKIPILLSLPDHITDIETKPTFTIADALQTHKTLKGMKDIPDPKWINYHLDKGHCLVMLDGLDDIINSNARKKVFEWIRREINFHRANRFLLTSRPQNFSGEEDLSGIMVMPLEILPFNKSQIENFVYKMCTAVIEQSPELETDQKKLSRLNHKTVTEKKPDRNVDPEVLLPRLQENTTVWEFAHNPLLLAMSVCTHIEDHTLPEKRVEFYERVCDRLLSHLKDERGGRDTRKQYKSVLQLLSYTLMQQAQTSHIDIQDADRRKEIESLIQQIDNDMTLEQFLQKISEETGLIRRIGEEGSYSYLLFHSTVKEYLAAAYLHETRDGWKLLIDKIDQPAWKEIILLYCAMGDASPIIKECLQKEALALAFACEKEKERINDPTVTDALNKLRETITTETDPIRRSIIAKSKLEQLLMSMIPLSQNIYILTEYISYSEYELILKEQSDPSKFYWPDHWSAPSSLDTNQSKETLFGVRSSDAEAFCQAITAKDRDGWRYRPPTSDESTRIKTDESLRNLCLNFPPNTGYFDGQQQFHWKADVPQLELPDIKRRVKSLLEEDRHILTSADTLSPLVGPLALEVAQALNNNLIQRANDSAFTKTCAETIDKALNRVPAHALDLSKFVESFAFSSSINHQYVYIHDRDFIHVQRLIQVLEDAIRTILKRKYNLSADQAKRKDLTTLRWCIRCYTWIIAHTLLYWSEQAALSNRHKKRWPFHNGRQMKQVEETYQQALDYYFNLCISFALLELRIKGEIAPWEGILLVRER